MAPPPEPLRLLRSAAVAGVAAAAQQPREAGRSNSPTTWLTEEGGLRALRPPGQEAGEGTRREPLRKQNAPPGGTPQAPRPPASAIPISGWSEPQTGSESLVLTSLVLKPRYPGQAHGLPPEPRKRGVGAFPCEGEQGVRREPLPGSLSERGV